MSLLEALLALHRFICAQFGYETMRDMFLDPLCWTPLLDKRLVRTFRNIT